MKRAPDEESSKPGPKPKKKQPSASVRRADSGSVLGLATAVASLKLSPVAKKTAGKKPRAKKAAHPKKKPEATKDMSSEQGEDSSVAPDLEDSILDSDEEVNQKQKAQEAGKGKVCAKAKAEKKNKQTKRGKAKAKSMCKDKPAGKKRPCMESFLAKQWLAFREEQLKALAETHPSLGYHEKVKLVAQRPGKLCPISGCQSCNVGNLYVATKCFM